MLASIYGRTETAAFLIQKGAQVGGEGCSSLIIASQGGHTEVVLLLLENGAQIHMVAGFL